MIAYIEGIVVYSSAARKYHDILAAAAADGALGRGAAQEAYYPAGTLGDDIQAVTVAKSRLPRKLNQ